MRRSSNVRGYNISLGAKSSPVFPGNTSFKVQVKGAVQIFPVRSEEEVLVLTTHHMLSADGRGDPR